MSSTMLVENEKISFKDLFIFEGIMFDLFQTGDAGTVPRLPNIIMKTATGSTLTGWLASQTDILSEDWIVLI